MYIEVKRFCVQFLKSQAKESCRMHVCAELCFSECIERSFITVQLSSKTRKVRFRYTRLPRGEANTEISIKFSFKQWNTQEQIFSSNSRWYELFDFFLVIKDVT